MALPKTKYKDDGVKKRVLPKKGFHDARLKVIADLGTVKATDPKFSDRRMMMWLWELVNLSKKGKVVYIQHRVPFSESSKVLKAILGEWLHYNIADIKKMDIEDILNEAAELKIVHSNDGKYANVKDVGEPTRKVKPGLMDAICVTLDDKFDMANFKKLPEWIQNLAIESDEFVAVSGEGRRGKKKGGEEKKAKRKKRG